MGGGLRLGTPVLLLADAVVQEHASQDSNSKCSSNSYCNPNGSIYADGSLCTNWNMRERVKANGMLASTDLSHNQQAMCSVQSSPLKICILFIPYLFNTRNTHAQSMPRAEEYPEIYKKISVVTACNVYVLGLGTRYSGEDSKAVV